MDINYVYNRKQVKKDAENKQRLKILERKIKETIKIIKKKYSDYLLIKHILNYKWILPQKVINCLLKASLRKRKKIIEYNQKRHAMIRYRGEINV